MKNLFAKAFPVALIKSRGWNVTFIDDGFGEAGYYAYLGDEIEPDLETSICATKAEAAREALGTYPNVFS